MDRHRVLPGILAVVTMLAAGASAGSILEDDFEAYGVNAWPSSNWVANANAVSDPSRNRVVSDPADAGNQVLRVYGSTYGSWGALAFTPYDFGESYLLDVRVRNGSEPMYGVQPYRASLHMRHGTNWPAWTNPARQLMLFRDDGQIYSGDGRVLQSYATDRWYDVRIQYSRVATDLTIQYWIDGVDRGISTLTIPDLGVEESLNHVGLVSHQGSAYYDDLFVAVPPGPPAPGSSRWERAVAGMKESEFLKKALDWIDVASLAAGASVPVTNLAGAVLAISGAAVHAAVNAIIKDPPDSNYGVPVTPHFVVLPATPIQAGVPVSVHDAMRALARNDADRTSYLLALLAAAEKYQGAQIAGDTLWMGEHATAALGFLSELELLSDDRSGLLSELLTQMQLTGWDTIADTADVMAFQDSLRGGLQGFMEDYLALFSSGSRLEQAVLDALLSADPLVAQGALSDHLAVGLQGNRDLADEFGRIRAAPEPSSVCTWLLGTVVLGLAARRRRAR